MVRLNFESFEEQYAIVRQSACGGMACSVLVLVALEVDAMAASKMLTQMLRSDNIPYAIRPVSNFDDVIFTIQNNVTADIKTVFMINCGAIYDIPKHFNLEQGSDLRCYILDNHRPIHLKNIYSRHNVVVFDDADANDIEDDLPSEASEMASDVGDDDMDLESSDEEVDEDDEEFDEEEGERGRPVADDDEEFDAGENDVTREEDYDFTAEENAADEEKSGASAAAEDEDEEEEEVDEVDEAGSAVVSQKAAIDMADSDDEDNESMAKMKKARGARKLMLEDDDEEEEGAAVEEAEDADEENAEEEDEEAEDMDKTFIAPYMKTRRGSGADADEASEDLQETESADEAGEGEGDEEEDDDDVHIVGRKRRRMVDPGREKRQRIQQYYCKAVT